MANDTNSPQEPKKNSNQIAREKRLKEALRVNLQRRRQKAHLAEGRKAIEESSSNESADN